MNVCTTRQATNAADISNLHSFEEINRAVRGLPEGVAEDGYERTIVVADCSSVKAVEGLFE